MRKPLEIFITIDTEASIAGCFANPEKYRPLIDEPVDGNIAGQSEGLGFLLRTLQRHELKATFFTESLQTRYFGIEPMQRRVEKIFSAGQDVQLHLHPCWLNFEKGQLLNKKPNDQSTNRPISELISIFNEARQRYCDWGFGNPVAVRTGNFSTGLDTFIACRETGLKFSSNIAAGLYLSDDPALQHFHSFQKIEGVTELPLTSFGSYKPKGSHTQRIMAITACSFSEINSALLQAYQQGLDAVCILTHPFEFFKSDNFRFENMRVNRLNQQRFIQLCELIANNSEYQCQTFGALNTRALAYQKNDDVDLQCSYFQMLQRTKQNVINDYFL